MNLFLLVKCFILLLLFSFCNGQGILKGKTKEKDTTDDPDAIDAQYHPGYRKVNWCVTGKDEPELHLWPFTQFNWYLRRAFYRRHAAHFRYSLSFFDIYTEQKHTGLDGRLYKTMHAVFKAEKRGKITESLEENWEPLPLEGVVIQANSNPFTMGLPTGQFFEPGNTHTNKSYWLHEVNCADCHLPELWAKPIACRKRAKIHIEHPTIMGWHHLQPPANVSHKMREFGPGNLPPTVKRQGEVHANFRFFSPKCSAVRRMSFIILVVRSFVKHEYDLFVRGPYEVTIRDQEFLSDIHPSPYNQFYTANAICHHPSASDLTLHKPRKFDDFEMNHYFDCCIREEENIKSWVTVEILRLKGTRSTSCEKKIYDQTTEEISRQDPYYAETVELGQETWWCFYPFLPRCPTGEEEADFERADDYYRPCPQCIVPSSTTAAPIPKVAKTFIKRSVHGFLMIMTNFCLQPLVIYIARFYKETYNTKQRKGNKTWYWFHLGGGMISSGTVYFGYFAGSSGTETGVLAAHVYIGNIYIVTLALCYVTSWGRHKNTIVTTMAEFVHACLGYVTIALAVASIATVPTDMMGLLPQIFCYMMLATQGVFMVILTCNICLFDRKIGMRPRRRHFPTVEARFDEIRIPGNKFRIICLLVFAGITLFLSVASLFMK